MRITASVARFVEHGKQTPALWWSFSYFFLLLTAYYVLRPVRDAMGANADVGAVFPPALIAWCAQRGIAVADFALQILFTGTFLCMLLLQPIYGWLVSRFPRRIFLPLVYVVFIACLVFFYSAFKRELPGRGAVFFIWMAVFNLFAVSVFWSFMADIFSTDQAKQFYGYIGAGGTLGGLLGPLLTKFLVVDLGVARMILVAIGCLVGCLFCILALSRWAKHAEQQSGRHTDAAMGGGVWEGLRLIAQDPLLRALALLMFFGVGVGTLLYNQQREFAMHLLQDTFRTRFYSNLDLYINILTLLIQVFLTRRIIRTYGIAPTLMMPALAVLLGYALLTLSPLPIMLAMVQIVTRAGEFSLGKMGRETIYTKVNRQSRYKAKAAIDTVVYRGGDLSFAWVHKGLFYFLGSRAVFAGGFVVATLMSISAWRVIRLEKHRQASA